MGVKSLLKHLTNIIQTCYILINIVVIKVYILHRQGKVRHIF